MTTTTEPNDNTLTVPATSEHIARIFSTAETSIAIAYAINLLGEENFLLLADYVAALDNGIPRETLLGNFCESWSGDIGALSASVDLLSKLSATTALRAVMALQIGIQNPNLISKFLPFYRGIAGFKS